MNPMQFAQIFCLFFTANTIIYCFKITFRINSLYFALNIPSKYRPKTCLSFITPNQCKFSPSLTVEPTKTHQNDTFISCSRLKLLCCVFNVQFFVHFVSSSSSPQIPSIIYCTKSGSKCTNDAFIRY
eukprot:438435_1